MKSKSVLCDLISYLLATPLGTTTNFPAPFFFAVLCTLVFLENFQPIPRNLSPRKGRQNVNPVRQIDNIAGISTTLEQVSISWNQDFLCNIRKALP